MAVSYRTYTFDGPNQVNAPARTRQRKKVTFINAEGEAYVDYGKRQAIVNLQSYVAGTSFLNVFTNMTSLMNTHTATAGTLTLNGKAYTSVIIADNGIRFGNRFYAKPDGNFLVPVNVRFIIPAGT